MSISILNIIFIGDLQRAYYKVNCQKIKKAGWPYAKPALDINY